MYVCMYVCICVYIYIYIYIYIYTCIALFPPSFMNLDKRRVREDDDSTFYMGNLLDRLETRLTQKTLNYLKIA